MLKKDNFTRAEICSYLAHSIRLEKDPLPHNDFVNYLIEEFSDKDLSLDTETGFFVYTGPELPAIPVKRKK